MGVRPAMVLRSIIGFPIQDFPNIAMTLLFLMYSPKTKRVALLCTRSRVSIVRFVVQAPYTRPYTRQDKTRCSLGPCTARGHRLDVPIYILYCTAVIQLGRTRASSFQLTLEHNVFPLPSWLLLLLLLLPSLV